MQTLKFRRQFLLSPNPTDQLKDWKHFNVQNQYLYVHPDCMVYTAKEGTTEVFILGHLIHPENETVAEQSVANGIAKAPKVDAITKLLYPLTGRFVIIIATAEEFLFFNDACGLKSLFYTARQGQLVVASQPLLLEFGLDGKALDKSRSESYLTSTYVQKNKEHWLPSGTSLFPNVFHLVPNHYLSSKTKKQVRYWPNQHIQEIPYEQGKNIVAKLLKQTIELAAHKYNLGLGVTSGYDSRILLSASKNVKDKMLFYTLRYRHLNAESRDVRIPKSLSRKADFKHHLWDCNFKVDAAFKAIYQQNSDMNHFDDWGKIASGIKDHMPAGTMAIKGSCSETGRCYFYKNGKHPQLKDYTALYQYNPGWQGFKFIDNQLHNWFTEAKKSADNYGNKLLDLFHWEVSTGSWQTQNQLEWDMVHDTLTPFNNRKLLDTMLSMPTFERSKASNYQLYRAVIADLWPELHLEPINPELPKERLKIMVKGLLVKLGIEKYNH